MSWKVNFYPKETDKFLKKLDEPDRVMLGREILALRKYGLSRYNDSLKKMAGLQKVWEVRVKQYRIFLIQDGPETIQILHTMIKKSNKTPLEVIKVLRNRVRYFGGEI